MPSACKGSVARSEVELYARVLAGYWGKESCLPGFYQGPLPHSHVCGKIWQKQFALWGVLCGESMELLLMRMF
jgi:hypothetical protein